EDFADTYSLVQQTKFSFIYAFAYSPRKKTPAMRFSSQVPEPIKKQRLAQLLELQNSITLEHHNQEVGQLREVLFLYESKKEPHTFYGRTEHFRLVKVVRKPEDGPSLVGLFATIKIYKASMICLEGTIENILSK
ncbi:MAG: tRNA (N6-isopentenyl adenosine(37)-C2)-methylthiotransferase MiaB, partial [Proteobacteria bacterium]|nr:tRNA (N6-isopentenyl adenosine(37)-C2)-methylthiotransferase MiaB [Pseudomonadota bacterium]